MQTQRTVELYYRRVFSAGRSALGRALDYIALRLVLFCAAFLFFRPRVTALLPALLLALTVLMAAMLLLRMVREACFTRFCAREGARLRGEILSERLMLLPERRFAALAAPLAGDCTPCFMQCAEAADANALLACLRAEGSHKKLAVCSTAGFSASARAFAAARPERLMLIETSTLIAAAEKTELRPSEAELCAHIIRMETGRRAQNREKRRAPFAEGGAKKYFLAAAVLVLASFITRYSLYYRMLAGFCMLLAVTGLALGVPKRFREEP